MKSIFLSLLILIGCTTLGISQNVSQIIQNKIELGVETKEITASIHKLSANLLNKPSNNGWKFWFVKRKEKLVSIDDLRSKYIKKYIEC